MVATATLTRPANTTAYSSGQQVSATANGSTGSPLQFQMADFASDGGSIVGARLTKSATSLTNATFRIHLFDLGVPTLTNLGDQNNYAAPLKADYANYIGYMDFASGIAGTDAAWYEGVPSQQLLSFRCAAGGVVTIYGVLECTGAYTPASAEVFSVRLVSLPN